MSRKIKRRTKRLDYQLDEVKKTVKEYLYLDDDEIVDVLLAVYIANQVINTDPVWLLLIASSSNAKTELLRALDGLDDVYFLSEMTDKTFISGDKQPKGHRNPSLLFRLTDKVLVFKDFTEFSKAFGTGEEIAWKGKVGFLGACTHAYFKHHSVINTMGERFLIYRNDKMNPIRMGEKAAEMTGKEDKFRKRMKMSFHRYCKQFANIEEPGKINVRVQRKIDNKIVHLANLVAVARTGVERDYKGIVIFAPHPEGPPRLIKQLKTMAIALALSHGKSNITKNIFNTVKKIAHDAIPELRMEVLKLLWDVKAFQDNENYLSHTKKKWVRASDIAKGINQPPNTVKRVLEDLMILKVVESKEDQGKGEKGRNKPLLWRIKREIYQLIEITGFFDKQFVNK
jgi:hypothetical protein